MKLLKVYDRLDYAWHSVIMQAMVEVENEKHIDNLRTSFCATGRDETRF